MQQKRNKKSLRSARSRRRKSAPRRKAASAEFGGDSTAAMVPVVIRASKTRYGGGKLQYAQKAIVGLFPTALPQPQHVNKLKLTDQVNNRLKLDPGYHLGELDRMTVTRALLTLLDANR